MIPDMCGFTKKQKRIMKISMTVWRQDFIVVSYSFSKGILFYSIFLVINAFTLLSLSLFFFQNLGE